MNDIDMSILRMFNSIAHQSIVFDKSVVCLEGSNLLKGGIIVPLLWWLWFDKNNNDNNKVCLASTIVASLVAIAIARTFALILPYRSRPVFNSAINFQAPYGLDVNILDGWSSFPSDHAVFFFTLASGLFLANRLVGSFALVYTFFAICLPRIYVGHHFPTDIIAGIFLGVCIGCVTQNIRIRQIITDHVLIWEKTKPNHFYAYFFFLTAQMSFLFDSVRILAIKVANILNLY
ncbi:MAG: hypothetical protein A2X83_00790 [Desulfuromonadales bacterium GWD2_54_10]|nr:MAG: hypothetical protein A2X83_00790 [Desulfuromonadales bacterium GWD2_54_10]